MRRTLKRMVCTLLFGRHDPVREGPALMDQGTLRCHCARCEKRLFLERVPERVQSEVMSYGVEL